MISHVPVNNAIDCYGYTLVSLILTEWTFSLQTCPQLTVHWMPSDKLYWRIVYLTILSVVHQRGSGEKYITRSLLACTHHQVIFGGSNREEWDGWGM